MYNTNLVPVRISLDYIRQFLSDLDIYSYYAKQKVTPNVAISSPFRSDTNPSWSVFRSNGDGYMYKDFATGESGNVVKFVQTLEGVSYKAALDKIWHDLILIKQPKRLTVKAESEVIGGGNKIIEIKRKNFTKTDDSYWGQYGITRDILKEFNVYPINYFWVDGIQQGLYSEKEPMYAYKIFSKFKIYRPLSSKKDKWRTNCSNFDIQGWEQLPLSGETLIITKSLKDVMALKAIGYNAIAPHSECDTIPKTVIDTLRLRFQRILVFYDNDEPGIAGAKKVAEKHNLRYFNIPPGDSKDISDYIKDNSVEAAQTLLDNLINNI